MSMTAEICSSDSDSDAFERHLERRGVPQLWLTLLTLVVYAVSLTCGFVYDDRETVRADASTLERWSQVPLYFTTDSSQGHKSNFYRPITVTYCWAMNSVFGAKALGWHSISVLLHVVCVLMMFALAMRLLKRRSTALFAAALFAVHPTHVEAVTWVSAAGELLMSGFLLAAALSFLRWREGGSPGWLGVGLVTGAAALCCKETAVVLPVLLMALMLLPGTVRGVRAQFAAVGIFWCEVLAFLLMRSHVLNGFSHPLSGASNADMVWSWPAAIIFYVRQMCFPVNMTAFYPFALVPSANSPEFWLPLAGVILLAGAVTWGLRKSADWRLYTVCLVWIAAPLAPVLYLKLFPQYELVHDRYLYVSCVGLCIAAAAAITALAQKAESVTSVRLRGLAAVLLIGCAAAATTGYESWWQSDLTLFKRAVSITPNNEVALMDLGVVLMEHKQYGAGIQYLDRAIQLQPNNPNAVFNRGRAAWETGDNVTAERCFERAVLLAPTATRWLYMASVKLHMGKAAESESAARQALAMDPNASSGHIALAMAELTQGKKAEAIAEMEQEERLHPEEPGVRMALERARAQK